MDLLGCTRAYGSILPALLGLTNPNEQEGLVKVKNKPILVKHTHAELEHAFVTAVGIVQ